MSPSKIGSQPKSLFPLLSMKKLEIILGFDRRSLKKIAVKADSYYKPFNDYKGGKLRQIDNPTGVLKEIQDRINKRILSGVPLPGGMMGGVKGKKVQDNARVHVNQPVVITMDLRSCFPRIKTKMVFRVFRNHLQCSEEIAKLLTRLTTYKAHLPQGAPTSTTLANLSLIPMFEEMKKTALANGLSLTQWVDDITLSGPNANKLIDVFIRIIQKHGHAVRHKKVKAMSQSRRQEVTGIVVNRKQAVSRARIKDYKDTIFDLARKRDSVTEEDLSSILGKIEFVKSVKPNQARELMKLAERYLPLRKSAGARVF